MEWQAIELRPMTDKPNNRYSRTGDRECQPGVAQVGILRGGHRGAKMRLALIFPRFAESTTMKNLFQPLLLLIAGATQKELARQVRYLKQLRWKARSDDD